MTWTLMCRHSGVSVVYLGVWTEWSYRKSFCNINVHLCRSTRDNAKLTELVSEGDGWTPLDPRSISVVKECLGSKANASQH